MRRGRLVATAASAHLLDAAACAGLDGDFLAPAFGAKRRPGFGDWLLVVELIVVASAASLLLAYFFSHPELRRPRT